MFWYLKIGFWFALICVLIEVFYYKRGNWRLRTFWGGLYMICWPVILIRLLIKAKETVFGGKA